MTRQIHMSRITQTHSDTTTQLNEDQNTYSDSNTYDDEDYDNTQ